MIFEALFLAFTLGNESAERKTAAIKAKSMMNDQETMRREFFAKSRKWQEDMFTLFGTELIASGKDFHWHEALEKLALLEEGYFPYSLTFELPITNQALEKSKLDGFDCKIVPTASGKYADLYLKLSDVEKYIAHRNSSGNYYRPSIYEEIPQEIRSLFYDGKVTIGVPFGQDGYIPSQVMTIPEAREFMRDKMEERFQKQR
jgi:hypothetical protein